MYKKQWSSANYLPADAHSPLAAAPVALKPMCREIGPATQLCGMWQAAIGFPPKPIGLNCIGSDRLELTFAHALGLLALGRQKYLFIYALLKIIEHLVLKD